MFTFRIHKIDDPERKESLWEETRSYEGSEALKHLLFDCQKFGVIVFPPLSPPMASKFEEHFLEAPIIQCKQIERYIGFP